MEKPDTNQRGWHIANWTALGWLETAIKAVAIVIGIFALVKSISVGAFALPWGLRFFQLIVMTTLALGLVAAIFDRLRERELISMIFVLFNNLAHWGIVSMMLVTRKEGSLVFVIDPEPIPESHALLIAFCALMLLGDLVKIVFIKTTNFTVRNVPSAVLYGLTSFYLVGYAVILILEYFRTT